MPFDPWVQSGLMYKETIISTKSRDESDEVYTKAAPRPGAKRRHERTQSLVAMAIATILRNLDLLTEEVLEPTPAPLLDKIWTAIRRRNLDSLRIWKLFAPTGCLGLSTVRSWNARLDLTHAVNRINSSNFSWLVDLEISSGSHTIDDLTRLTTLNNLQNLQLVPSDNGDTTFDDRIWRAWAFSAKVGCFPRLRMVFIEGHDGVTGSCLKYLSDFPSLDTFCVHRCKFRRRSKETCKRLGWRSEHSVFLDFVKRESDREAYFKYSNVLLRPIIEAYILKRRSESDSDQKKVPLLQVAIDSRSGRKFCNSLASKQLFCFERDWDFKRDETVDAEEVPPPPNKRRKLRYGKSIALDQMLNGL